MTTRPIIRRALPVLLAALSAASPAAPPEGPRVRLQTDAGVIVIELAARQAPISSTNFLAYVAKKRFDGMTFYRAARSKSDPRRGLVQGGIRHKYTLMLNPIEHEPTSRTGLRHVDGTVSMARYGPGTAMGDFFVTVGPAKSLDAAGDYPGYAAFGHVVAGMDVIRRMLALPTLKGGDAAMKDQMIAKPVRIITARQVG